MTQAGKAVINQQEGTKGGASGDDLGAPFPLSALSKSALTYRRGSAGESSPAGIYQQTPTATCTSDAAAPITGGLGDFSHQQAAPGIYRCLACQYYQRL